MSDENQIEIVDADLDSAKVSDFDKKFARSFTVTWRNKETGIINTGTFTARRPTLGVLGRIAVYKAELNGGKQLDPTTEFLHQMMADLHFILVGFPDWWRPGDFFTADPLREVWDYVSGWLNTFRGGGAG